MKKDMCVCGHDVDWHEDGDGGTSECQLCECQQFYDYDDAVAAGLVGCQTPPLGCRVEEP